MLGTRQLVCQTSVSSVNAYPQDGYRCYTRAFSTHQQHVIELILTYLLFSTYPYFIRNGETQLVFQLILMDTSSEKKVVRQKAISKA